MHVATMCGRARIVHSTPVVPLCPGPNVQPQTMPRSTRWKWRRSSPYLRPITQVRVTSVPRSRFRHVLTSQIPVLCPPTVVSTSPPKFRIRLVPIPEEPAENHGEAAALAVSVRTSISACSCVMAGCGGACATVGVTLEVTLTEAYPEEPCKVSPGGMCLASALQWMRGRCSQCLRPQVELSVDKGLTSSQAATLREVIESTVCLVWAPLC